MQRGTVEDMKVSLFIHLNLSSAKYLPLRQGPNVIRLYALVSLHSQQTWWRNMPCMFLLSGIMQNLNVWYLSIPFVSLDIFFAVFARKFDIYSNLKSNGYEQCFHKNEHMVMYREICQYLKTKYFHWRFSRVQESVAVCICMCVHVWFFTRFVNINCSITMAL